VHELGHRMQSVMLCLDNHFCQLHAGRTAGEPLKSLARLRPWSHYGSHEVTSKDKYVDYYFGREYDCTALEVLTMTYLGLLHGGMADATRRSLES
jgi:hypothetical protein